jgi:HAE1 family hydrophobic/amphiphilic exporter-1
MMLFLGIIILGIISWTKLPQEFFPSITYPQITVVTSYQNAAPEEIESLITKVIEEGVGTVNNVKRVSSISKEGISLVMAEFNWGTNMDFAALNVREKVDLIKERLPRDSQEPIVMKYNPFDLPIMNLAVTGPMSSMELREICRKYIKDAVEKVEGVASAAISGGEEREILVEIDQPRLRASQIAIVSVVDSLKATNLNYPAGTIKESFYEYLIRTMGEYQKVEEVQETPTALDTPDEGPVTKKEKEKQEQKGRRLVYLKDIARVKDTVKEKTSISRYNGKDSVSLVIRKQSGTNSLSVAKGIKKTIQQLLKERLPKGLDIQVTYDQSKFIQVALGNVRDAGIQGGILSFLVLFFFLWELKSSLIITAAIPICVTATTVAMYFSNINLNIMSLGGLAMGVGMVVDNANIVIENIFRYRQLGKPFKDAIIDGTSEMTGAIMGSTLTNIAVFLPFAFVVGIAGQIFKQLSFTISFSLVASIIVALSLVPVLLLLSRESRNQKAITAKVEAFTEKYRNGFKDFVVRTLNKKELVLLVISALFLISVVILLTQPREFMPKADQRQFIIKIDLPPGSRMELTDRVASKIERLLLSIPDTKDITVNVGSSEDRTSTEQSAIQALGSHQAQLLVNLKKRSGRLKIQRSSEEVIQYIKNNLENQSMEGANLEYIAQETSFGSALEQGAPIAIEIKGPNLEKLTELSASIQADLKKIQGLYGIKTSMPSPSPETKLHILKDKASLYGLSVRDIAVTAQVALKGYVATKFKEKKGEEDVDIRVRLRPEDRSDLGNLRRLLIHSLAGADIPLSEIAFLTKGSGPTEIRRIDQQRNIMVTANVYKRSLAQITAAINKIIKTTSRNTTKDYAIDSAGEQQRTQESFTSLAFALALAIALVYMIMAAEFESFWQPLLIMFTVPLSLIGVAFSLFITRTPLNVVAYLGIIMLGGIAVNNGIVLIELVNELRKNGYSAREAVIEASKTRLRPILMTSLTTILGLLPLALGIGEGAELQAPLALTVMGGLISSTFLTLIFIPSLYLTVAERFFGFAEESIKIDVSPEIEISSKQINEEEPAAAEINKQEPPLITPPVTPVVTAEIKPAAMPVMPGIKPPETPAKPEKIVGLPKEDKPRQEKTEINPRQQELLEKLKTIKKITRKEYAKLFNISIPTAARDLKELVDKKLIKAQGPLGPGRWYELL